MSDEKKRTIMKSLVRGLLLLCALRIGSASAQSPQSSAGTMFEKKCYSCHNIGNGDKKGPDLKGLTARRSGAWIHEFAKSPAAMNRKGDPAAAELFRKFAPEVMPDQDLTDDQIDALVAFIEDLSKKNQIFVPAGARLSRAIAPGDADSGFRLFTGRAVLQRGATACIACHHINGAGTLGGGTLGPNLTAVNIKYRDPELISVLQNSNFPTMNSVFATRQLTEEEIVQLFALFQNSKQAHPTAPARPGGPAIEPKFLLIGFGALLFALVALNLIWKGRLRSVREGLVRGRRP